MSYSLQQNFIVGDKGSVGGLSELEVPYSKSHKTSDDQNDEDHSNDLHDSVFGLTVASGEARSALVTLGSGPVILTFASVGVFLADTVLARRITRILSTHRVVRVSNSASLAESTSVLRRDTTTGYGLRMGTVSARVANTERFAVAGGTGMTTSASTVLTSFGSNALAVLLVVSNVAIATGWSGTVLGGVTDASLGEVVEGSVTITSLLEFGHSVVVYSSKFDSNAILVEQALRYELQLVVFSVFQILGAENEHPSGSVIRLGVVLGGLSFHRSDLLCLVVDVLQENEVGEQVSDGLGSVSGLRAGSVLAVVELGGETKLQEEITVGVESFTLGRFYVAHERLVTLSQLEEEVEWITEGLSRGLRGKKRLLLLDGQTVLRVSLVEANVDVLTEGEGAGGLRGGTPSSFTEQTPSVGGSSAACVESQNEEALERIVGQSDVQIGGVGDGEFHVVGESLSFGGESLEVFVGEMRRNLDDILVDRTRKFLASSRAGGNQLLLDVSYRSDGETERKLSATGPRGRDV